jgi:hypothetical protein
MIDQFLPSNRQINDAVNSARSSAEVRAILLSTLVAQGTLVRSRDDCDNTLLRQPQAEGSLPVSNFKYEKEIRFHPESGKRSLMIRANTMEDLLALEAQVLHY